MGTWGSYTLIGLKRSDWILTHKPEVVGSNPTPATNGFKRSTVKRAVLFGFRAVWAGRLTTRDWKNQGFYKGQFLCYAVCSATDYWKVT
jgi:hypothetical protein